MAFIARARGRGGLRGGGGEARGGAEPVAIGGVVVGLEAALAGGLELTVDLEAGRSYYARLDGDPAPVAEPVARLGVALSRSFGD